MERYYLTPKNELATFVKVDRMIDHETYVLKVGNKIKRFNPAVLTFVPVEKLNWFKSKAIGLVILFAVFFSCSPRTVGYVNHDFNGHDLSPAYFPRKAVSLPFIHLQIISR